MSKKTVASVTGVKIPHGAEIKECMHCAAKIYWHPIDPSLAAQKFRAINFPSGTYHKCKGYDYKD